MNKIIYRPELGDEWSDVKVVFESGACWAHWYLEEPTWAYTSHKWYRIVRVEMDETKHPKEVVDKLRKAKYIHGDIAKTPDLPIAAAKLVTGDILCNWNLEEKFLK